MTPITNCHGTIVGYVEDEIYYTERRPEHFFVMFNGYAVSVDVLVKAYKAGASLVKMKIPDRRFVLCPIGKWALEGAKYMDGDDEQRVLSMEQLRDDTYSDEPARV